MRKIFICLFGVLFLTGCGGNDGTVSCTKTTTEDGYKMTEKNETVIKNNKAHSVNISIEMIPDAGDGSEVFLEYYSMGIDEQFANIKNASGISYSSKIEGNKHMLKIGIEFDKLKESEFTNFSDTEMQMISDKDVENASAKVTKENLEKEGYTCK